MKGLLLSITLPFVCVYVFSTPAERSQLEAASRQLIVSAQLALTNM